MDKARGGKAANKALNIMQCPTACLNICTVGAERSEKNFEILLDTAENILGVLLARIVMLLRLLAASGT